MFNLSPGEEKGETIEEETIEDLVQRNYTETVEEIEKDNFMFSIGNKRQCGVFLFSFIVFSIQIC